MPTLLRFTTEMSAAIEEVVQLGGRVTHQFSASAFVAEVADNFPVDRLRLSTGTPTHPLDASTQLAVDAWNAFVSKPPGSSSMSEGLDWDSPGYQPPRYEPRSQSSRTPAATDQPDKSTGTPTSEYLVGSVAVGVIIVSGASGAEVLSKAEQQKIVSEVQAGLNWIATFEPKAQVSFAYDLQVVTVSAKAGPDNSITDAYEKYESGWRDEALKKLGYSPGRNGYQKYVIDLRTAKKTKWAYVAFFTKYPLNHFAYAVWEKVVMQYENDGWGPDQINRVFAHESCHIFGAADEYGSCSCTSVHGKLSAPNKNCRNCFPPGTQVDCIMGKNLFAMCRWTRKQIGWDPELFPAPSHEAADV